MIYGRRRVGKTELILRFARRRRSVYLFSRSGFDAKLRREAAADPRYRLVTPAELFRP